MYLVSSEVEEVVGSMELVLRMVVDHHVDAGNRNISSARPISAFNN